MDSKVIGTILVVIGIIMLVFAGLNYETMETVVDAGPIQIEAKQNNFVRLSPILGAVFLVGGIIVLWRGKGGKGG